MVQRDAHRCILILYTTLYREGGLKFERAAAVLAAEKLRQFPDRTVICRAVESKHEFVSELETVGRTGGTLDELHFIGHSGMYGIMFGTTKWPEQMSPHEWRHQKIPFAPKATAFFHACRTGRWFAPFFARTFGVKTFGHFWYTTVSRKADRFAWDAFAADSDPVYIISVPGKKSHGLVGSLRKYLGRPAAYPMLEFVGNSEAVDTTYDAVAPLYDETFEDIAPRQDELRWLRRNLAEFSQKPRVLDIGSGTGSFLRAIRDLTESADGVDLSRGMVEQARRRSPGDSGLRYSKIDGPALPFVDASFDVVTSVLSFRYLDWDPILKEIHRVLKPGGRFMVIDMVAAPLELRHWPHLLRDKLKQRRTLRKYPAYAVALRRMVMDPRWKKMLEFNPIRSEHEMKWFLESRFPEGRLEIINYGWNSRILAFQSAPILEKTTAELSYP